uniref:Uncharacterized protein n=1 Tax=viral metagenome TaxID=1070528 RepID=A0A6C0AEP6_9ZZZZ
MKIYYISDYLETKDDYFKEFKPDNSCHITGDIINCINFTKNIISIIVLYDSTLDGCKNIWKINFNIEEEKITSYLKYQDNLILPEFT